jgi:DNA topoisomerase VI subunit A
MARRTKQQIQQLKTAIYEAAKEDRPMTVRQLFYRLVSDGVIKKSEKEYKTTVVRLLGDMRRNREIPFNWIADNTRWQRKPDTYSDLEQVLEDTAKLYRRAVWQNQDAYVEVWLEKEALSGVLFDVTAEWDVPLMVTRGYPSLSYLHSAGQAINEEDKPAYIYYFGDHDPSGVDIPRKVEQGIREFAPDAEVYFERAAVTLSQIDELNLQTRPTKQTDTRAKSFEGESVEVDAIRPAKLKEIVRACIEQHVNRNALATLQAAEESEREFLDTMAFKVGVGELTDPDDL